MYGHAPKAAAVLLLILLFGGCAGSGVRYHNPDMDFGAIRRVAVLPFANLTRDASAAERARDVFTTMLLATNAMYVIPPGEVFRGISRASLADPTRPSVEEVKRLAGIVSVDAVITGLVREYGEVRSGQSTANVISLSLQMMEVQTGTVVWTAESTKGGITVRDRLFGGGGEPMNKVTQDAVEDLLEKLFGSERE
jgi:polysaccharide biosynthesis protein PelC